MEDSTLLAREVTAALEQTAAVEVVSVARSEDAACHLLRTSSPLFDLVVLDVFLAEGSGLGVLRTLQSSDMDIRVVVLTNLATVRVRKHCVALGADRIFDKARQLDEFLNYVAAISRPTDGGPSLDIDTVPVPLS